MRNQKKKQCQWIQNNGRDITLVESDEEEYLWRVRIANAFSNNYSEYESEVDKNKTSIEEYLVRLDHIWGIW